MRSLHQLDGFVPLTKSKLTTCALLRKSTRTRTFEAESLCCGKQLNHVHNVSPENISPRLCHLHGGLHQDDHRIQAGHKRRLRNGGPHPSFGEPDSSGDGRKHCCGQVHVHQDGDFIIHDRSKLDCHQFYRTYIRDGCSWILGILTRLVPLLN